MCDKQTLIKEMIVTIWNNRDVNGVEKYFAKDIIYDNFIEKTDGKQNLILVLKKFYKAFSESNLIITRIYSNKDIVFIRFSGLLKQIGIFYGLKPVVKNIRYNVIGIYKIKNSLIEQGVSISNLKFNIMQHGAIPSFTTIDAAKLISVKEILLEIQQGLHLPLTKQEIITMSLWLTGHSNKDTAKLLNISSRTVEEYRTRIKTKLKISNKKQLYDFIRNFFNLDIFLELSDKLRCIQISNTVRKN